MAEHVPNGPGFDLDNFCARALDRFATEGRHLAGGTALAQMTF
jgi:hypothetical protein